MRALQVRLVVLITLALVAAALALSWLALNHFEHDLPPEMARTVTAVSYSTSEVMEKAYQYGVPLEQMAGVEEFLDSIRKDNPGIAYLVLTGMDGKLLWQSGYADLAERPAVERLADSATTEARTTNTGTFFNTSVPLVFGHTRVGTLHLGQRAALIEYKLREISFDVITVLIVASLIAIELLRFVLAFVIATPADVMRKFLARIRQGEFSGYLPHERLGGVGQLSGRFNAIVASINERYHILQEKAAAAGEPVQALIRQRLSAFRFHARGERQVLAAAAVDHIRWPFFLLIFADSLSLSFFPVYVEQFYVPGLGLSKSLVIGLPISIFMFTWALSMPWAGMWSDRVGQRKAFVAGAAVTTAGLVATACAQSLYDLLVWRSLTALGYGLVFITTQSYVTNNTPAAQRTRGMAMFLSSFFAGSLSGSAIGGILADRLGHSLTIFLSAVFSASAALFVLRFLQDSPASPAAARKKLSFNDFKLLLRNKKFVAVTFLAAIPAKIALTGFLYYSVPLYLKLLGNNQSTTGRIMMSYGLAIITLSPFLANLADKYGKLRWFVSIGGYSAALSMFIIYYFDNTLGLLASITLLGIAHSIGVSPQMALINDFCKEVVQEVGNGIATGIFRLIERLGNVLGPIIAGILITNFGFKGAFLGIGMLGLVCVTCFTLMFFWFEYQQRVSCNLE